MPVSLLTKADRARLSGFPEEIPTEELYAHFSLTGWDRSTVPSKGSPMNRLGYALSLCAVRYLGFCPEDLSSCPENTLWYVYQQLGLGPEVITGYPEREQTRTDHLKKIYEHLGYRKPNASDLRDLLGWLVERALEHEDPSLLVRLAAEKLKAEKVVRPSVSRLERMVAAARQHTDEQTYRALSHLLDSETRARLDEILSVDQTLSPPRGSGPPRTRHAWLKEGATSNTPKAILDQLDKLSLQRKIGSSKNRTVDG